MYSVTVIAVVTRKNISLFDWQRKRRKTDVLCRNCSTLTWRCSMNMHTKQSRSLWTHSLS